MSAKLKLVYSPKTESERIRRQKRADALVGTPFIQLPGNPDQHKVQFISKDGYKIRTRDVEMVYNDAMLMDAISGYVEPSDGYHDGPQYKDTISGIHLEVYEFAVKAFAQ